MIKVCLNGTENNGWAMDEEMAHIRDALDGKVEFTDLDDCEILHSVYWWKLVQLPASKLKGKKIICSISNKPLHEFTEPLFMNLKNLAGLIISKSSEAVDEFSKAGVPSEHITYSVNEDVFKPMTPDSSELLEFRKKWNIPEGKYLIGNFHRDSQGRDVYSPKIQKGAEVFLAIVERAFSRNSNVHIVLAGPRRHWLRGKLSEKGIPFTYIGEICEGDDNHVNILSRVILNLLYNIIDIYVISSRWEGGPHSAMEASASQCKIISTPVGVSKDVLEDMCIFDQIDDAVSILAKDMDSGVLNTSVQLQYDCYIKKHTIKAVSSKILELYQRLDYLKVNQQIFRNSLNDDRLWSRIRNKLRNTSGITLQSKISVFWPDFDRFLSYYGIGNKDGKIFKKKFSSRNIEMLEGPEQVDVVISQDKVFLQEGQKWIHLQSSDFDVNSLLDFTTATITAFLSSFALEKWIKKGGKPSRPLVISSTSAYFKDPDYSMGIF